MIAGIAIVLFTTILLAVGIHHLIHGGTCSSTGYTRYGPAPQCPAGTGLWVAFLLAGIVGPILGALLAGIPNLVIPSMFTAIGLGSLTLLADDHTTSNQRTFAVVFGGCFLIAGLAVPAVALVRTWQRRA
jgi:hypothetical protein